MGWSYRCETGGFKEFLADRCRGWEYATEDGGKTTYKLLARCFKGMPTHGGNLWKVYEVVHTNPNGEVTKSERFIALDLLQCYQGCWGYKDIDESMGPCEVNCPLSYLSLAGGEPQGYAKEWRERVRQFHQAKVKPQLGAWYSTKKNASGIDKVQIVSLRPLRGITESGNQYRISSRILKERLVSDPKQLPDLSQFYGSLDMFRHMTGAAYTEGIKFLADSVGAHWLVDDIMFAQRSNRKLQQEGFQMWELKVNDDQTATLTCKADTNEPPLYKKNLLYTDFPKEGILLYFENNTLCLPAER